MQNPTGADISPHLAFKVLQAAERHNFMVVEDDIFCDLQVKITPRLATLDQLNRVIFHDVIGLPQAKNGSASRVLSHE
jgi:DNA-binding transcriptional MocR family regulator